MRDTTFDLIMVVKGRSDISFRGKRNFTELINEYLSDRSELPLYIFEENEELARTALKNAAEDYISTCDHPEDFLHDLLYNNEPNINEKLARALCNTIIRDGDRIVNGFPDRLMFYYRKDKDAAEYNE